MHPKDLEVYRALTRKGKPPVPENFLLRPASPGRPAEDSLSIAKTEAKAKGTLNCYGYAVFTVAAIETIPNLTVQEKRPELQPNPEVPDPDLLEIMGAPPATDEANALNCARDLVKAVLRYDCADKATRAAIA